MGIMQLFSSLRKKWFNRNELVALEVDRKRRCLFEAMESRTMFNAAPIHLGGIYVEEDSGADHHGDTFEIMFEGGAAGTQLKRLVINGDHGPAGLSFGDMIFDTAQGGLGADGAFNFSIVSASGITSVIATVTDGGSTLTLDFEGFDAGEKLVFSIDVDEVQDYDPAETDLDIINQGIDPIASGVEFQGSMMTGDFIAPHYYDVSGTSEFRNVYDGLFAGTNLLITSGNASGLANDDAGGRRDRTTGTMLALQQQPLPISISGTVFLDNDLDLVLDAGEQRLGMVTLALWKKVGSDYVYTGNTTVTDANGNYTFSRDLGLTPGTYQVRETQPTGLFSVGAIPGTVDGTATGSVFTSDVLSEIEVPLGGTDGIQYNFAEAQPASIAGSVYVDANNNGVRDAGERGIAGATVQVIVVNSIAPQQSLTLTTDANGNYSVTGLAPGLYRVVETQPLGYFDGSDRAGTVRGVTIGLATNPGDQINGVQLNGGDDGVNYDFGELEPGSISGRVHLTDKEGNCFSDTEILPPVVGAVIRLFDANGQLVAQTVTDANGEYRFEGLAPGSYTVVETTPAGLIDGGDHVGTINGAKVGEKTANDTLSNISLGSGQAGINYDFCEHLPSSIAGYVYHDRNDNGVRETGEEAVGGTTVVLFDAGGTQIATTVSDASGFYKFDGLVKGVYRIVEVQPTGWLDGKDTAGTIGGITSGIAVNPGDEIQSVDLLWGDNSIENDFGELLPGSISGRVHLTDREGNCFSDTEILPPVVGAVVRLFDSSGTLVGQTLTDSNGNYRFDNLRPGTYTVVETTPVGLIDGGDHVGTIGGVKVGTKTENDRLANIALGSGQDGIDYDFCEHLPTSIAGFVYHDRNDNGIRESGEEAISGTTVLLLDASGTQIASTTSDASGFYKFGGLSLGTYRVVEVQPGGWLDGKDAAGNVAGVTVGTAANPGDAISGVNLLWGDASVDNNFGELLPGSIEGIVHYDTIRNCLVEPGEVRMAGVTIELLDSAGNVIATTLTDVNGEYRFTGLAPGIYAVREIQPTATFHGGQALGTGGGVESRDLLSQIPVGSGDNLVDYNFCELPPGMISGYVFRDGDVLVTADGQLPLNIASLRDGSLTPDDLRLGGVLLELRNALTGEVILGEDMLPGSYGPGPVQVMTDANGYYQFTGLREGSYAIIQVQPTGYLDNLDTPGTTGGVALNPNSSVSPLFLQPFDVAGVSLNNDAILRIPVSYGGISELNNFSEVQLVTQPPAPPDPPLPPEFSPTPNLTLQYSYSPFVYAALNNDVLPRSPILNPPEYAAQGVGGDYTWHLSVVNGGSPRGNYRNFRVDQPSPLMPAKFLASSQWHAEHAMNGLWTLPGKTAGVKFGIEGATPLTGDFNGDGHSELALFVNGEWFIDINGNGQWDENDLWGRLGSKGDQPVVGDWDGDGKDDIGIFGPRWARDFVAIENEPGLPDAGNRRDVDAENAAEKRVDQRVIRPKNVPPTELQATNGLRTLQQSPRGARRWDLIDHVFELGTGTDRAISGDFNGDGIESIGIFRGGVWRLDRNGDGKMTDADSTIKFGTRGDLPVVGDFDGDGIDEIGVYRQGKWIIDTNHNGEIDAADKVFELGGSGDTPIVGDFNGDGIDEPGLYRAA